ncbi:hypothetical protein [Flavobacterium ovatum]
MLHSFISPVLLLFLGADHFVFSIKIAPAVRCISCSALAPQEDATTITAS